MLALLVSFLIAVYLLGPNLIARWAADLVVFRKTRSQSHAEEVARSILAAAIPLLLAIAWARWTGALWARGTQADVEIVFSALQSDNFFQTHHAQFFTSLYAFFWMNYAILWRLYFLVMIACLVRILVVLNYNRIWRHLDKRWMRTLLATIVPRISEWDLLFSDMLLPEGSFRIMADVLTKTGGLYQGAIQDRMLNADGSLQSITLANPRRFERAEFRKAKAEDLATTAEEYWFNVPGNLFIVMASDIANLNLRYIRRKPLSFQPSVEEREVLSRLLERLKEK
ncbi:hypothetical protein [Edaphobacter albus]|uniref:hypothetical protein n=1 Tax=Edaphobacter sp. 4G125 TaxID=2763071 RepID=UPI001645187A|nr:hypothetical protein [Edaphobacter sp. 4G125]QNI36806.1 hypothetical protein H7846_00190 [Edaphobacter sp. 4G125]